MAAFPTCSIEDAHQCLLQARDMLARTRLMCSRAQESLEETLLMREGIHAQIEDLAMRGPFRREFTTTLLTKILDAAIEGTDADMGNIQLLDSRSGQLRIHVQRGFEPPFLEFFGSVHLGQAACGMALQTAKRIIVADVADSPIFRSSDSLEIMLDAGVRSLQSTPLAGRSGRVWGMLSTHYKTVRQPRKGDFQLIDYLADWAAALLEVQQRLAAEGN